jgi:hypothetical protein
MCLTYELGLRIKYRKHEKTPQIASAWLHIATARDTTQEGIIRLAYHYADVDRGRIANATRLYQIAE